MTILEEAHRSLIFIEHDPLLYEDAREMTEYVSMSLRETSKEAAVLPYTPAADPYFDEEPKAEAKVVAIRLTCHSVNMEVSQAIE